MPPEDLAIMTLMDQQYLTTPFYGSRRMTAWLNRQGQQVSRKRVQRLMRTMGLEAIYRRPRTSQPAPEHKVYPYSRLRGNDDSTRQHGDHQTQPGVGGRYHLHPHGPGVSVSGPSGEGSNTLDAGSCIEALEEGLSKGKPSRQVGIQHRPRQPVHWRGLHRAP